jgi:hypothetical protein
VKKSDLNRLPLKVDPQAGGQGKKPISTASLHTVFEEQKSKPGIVSGGRMRNWSMQLTHLCLARTSSDTRWSSRTY